MTGEPPRLSGPRVALVPAPEELAHVPAGSVGRVLAGRGLRAGAGWPHEQTAAALAGAPRWLVAVGGEVIGECAWKGPPDVDGVVDLAYGLAPPARGQGLGTEAVALLVAWSERAPGVRGLGADVLVGNEPSRRVLRRLGFEEQLVDGRTVRYERGPVRLRGRHVC